MSIVIGVVLGLFGAFLGSFACAQVWRLRAQQLVDDKKAAAKGESDVEAPSEKELRQLKPLLKPLAKDRSECLSCHHQLAWYDLVPIVSWLSLWGRCRYCRKPIGYAEILAEVGLGLVFALSYWFWPWSLDSTLAIAALALWLVSCVVMTILTLYDAKWFLLPFGVNLLLIGVALVFRILMTAQGLTDIWSLVGAIALLAGLYGLFGLLGLVGFGDSILGVGLALLLGKWELAFLTLFLANFLGCVWLVPIALKGKLRRRMKIPFGPFLIIAAVIAMLWGQAIIDWFFVASSHLFIALMV